MSAPKTLNIRTQVEVLKETMLNEPNQVVECILFGSVFNSNVVDLESRLAGLCDPGSTDFQEHELFFNLKTSNEADFTTINVRRRFNFDVFTGTQWRFRYIARPEPDPNCPVVVRKVIMSLSSSPNMMDFVKMMGLRMDYEFILKGRIYTAGKIKVTVTTIQKTDKAGSYDVLKKIGDSSYVEMSMTIPDGTDYLPYARMLRAFADQFLPLIEMQKVEYWNK